MYKDSFTSSIALGLFLEKHMNLSLRKKLSIRVPDFMSKPFHPQF